MNSENPIWDDVCPRGSIDRDTLLPSPPRSLFDNDLFCNEPSVDNDSSPFDELDTLTYPSLPSLPIAAPSTPPPLSPPPSTPMTKFNSTHPWRSFLDDNCPLRKRVKVTIVPTTRKRTCPPPSAVPMHPFLKKPRNSQLRVSAPRLTSSNSNNCNSPIITGTPSQDEEQNQNVDLEKVISSNTTITITNLGLCDGNVEKKEQQDKNEGEEEKNNKERVTLDTSSTSQDLNTDTNMDFLEPGPLPMDDDSQDFILSLDSDNSCPMIQEQERQQSSPPKSSFQSQPQPQYHMPATTSPMTPTTPGYSNLSKEEIEISKLDNRTSKQEVGFVNVNRQVKNRRALPARKRRTVHSKGSKLMNNNINNKRSTFKHQSSGSTITSSSSTSTTPRSFITSSLHARLHSMRLIPSTNNNSKNKSNSVVNPSPSLPLVDAAVQAVARAARDYSEQLSTSSSSSFPKSFAQVQAFPVKKQSNTGNNKKSQKRRRVLLSFDDKDVKPLVSDHQHMQNVNQQFHQNTAESALASFLNCPSPCAKRSMSRTTSGMAQKIIASPLKTSRYI